MKKSVLFASAMVLLAATACNKEIQCDNPTPEAKPQVELSFNASLTVPTKTEIGVVGDKVDGVAEHQVYWSKGDKIAVYPHDPESSTGVTGVEFTSEDLAEAAAAEAEFKGTIDEADAYYAFYPATAGAKWVGKYAYFTVTLPAEQTSNGIASGFAVANVTGSEKVTFDHVCGFVKFTIDEDYANQIKKVEFSGNASEYLAGSLYVYPENPSNNKINKSEETKLVLTPAEGDTFAAGTYYFTSFPASLADGLTITFVNSDDQVATKTSPTKTDIERAGILNLGTVKDLVFENVTPPLANGTYAILAKKDDVYYAMASTHEANSNRLDEVKFDYSATETHLNSLVWTFTNVSGATYNVTNGGMHLVASSSNNAKLAEEGSPLTVVVNEDGTYCITAKVSDVTRYLSRNNTSEGFAFYGNTDQNEMLYLKAISYVEKPELVAPEISAVGNNNDKTIIVTWDDVDNATSYEVVCGDQTATVLTGVQTYTFTMSEYGTYEVTVTAKAEGYVYATSSVSEVVLFSNDALRITLNLSQNIFNLSTSKTNDAETEIIKSYDGYEYRIKATETCYYYSSKALMLGKKSSYILFPAIEGYKLSSVKACNCSGASSKVTIAICPSGSDTAISGGTASTITPGGSTTWSNLSTDTNTSYRLYVNNANAVQLTEIVLEYSK